MISALKKGFYLFFFFSFSFVCGLIFENALFFIRTSNFGPKAERSYRCMYFCGVKLKTFKVFLNLQN